MNKTDLKLYAITDRQWLHKARLSEHVKLAIEGGATMIHGSPLNKVIIYLLTELLTALKGNDSKCPHWYGFKVAFFLKHDIFLRRCVL